MEATIGDFAGGIHYRRDEIGNARLFCYELQNVCENNGVKFLFEHALTSVIRRAGKIYALQTVDANDEINNIEIDAVVIAAGSYSWPLGKLFGLSVPVRPAKGYSLTVPLDQSEIKPRYAIVDDALHAAIVPLAGDKLRLAGTAEFAGFDTTLSPQRAANLAQFLGRVYPNVKYDPAMVIPWCGLRPMTSDGRPIIGRSSIANVFLNTGHGPLGWTLACGSGKVLADEIVGNPPTYDIKAFSPSR